MVKGKKQLVSEGITMSLTCFHSLVGCGDLPETDPPLFAPAPFPSGIRMTEY